MASRLAHNQEILGSIPESATMIPSPFTEPEKDIVDDFYKLFKEKGYDQWGFFCSKPRNNEENDWEGYSNVISEDMIEMLENTLDFMKEKLNELNG